jgi:hypothetical protein
MSHARRRRPSAAARDHSPPAGRRLIGAAALVLAALVLVPWLVGHLTRWPLGPTLAAAVTLPPALYHWFRHVQGARPRQAAALSVAYAVLAVLILWFWSTT